MNHYTILINRLKLVTVAIMLSFAAGSGHSQDGHPGSDGCPKITKLSGIYDNKNSGFHSCKETIALVVVKGDECIKPPAKENEDDPEWELVRTIYDWDGDIVQASGASQAQVSTATTGSKTVTCDVSYVWSNGSGEETTGPFSDSFTLTVHEIEDVPEMKPNSSGQMVKIASFTVNQHESKPTTTSHGSVTVNKHWDGEVKDVLAEETFGTALEEGNNGCGQILSKSAPQTTWQPKGDIQVTWNIPPVGAVTFNEDHTWQETTGGDNLIDEDAVEFTNHHFGIFQRFLTPKEGVFVGTYKVVTVIATTSPNGSVNPPTTVQDGPFKINEKVPINPSGQTMRNYVGIVRSKKCCPSL